jgi:hypothetical protein
VATVRLSRTHERRLKPVAKGGCIAGAMTMLRLILASLALGLAGGAAAAQDAPSAACESLLPSGFGPAGAAACEMELGALDADPAQAPRRFALLQSRALHRLAASDAAGAAADLDGAAAAAADFPIAVRRSVEPGLDLGRALIARLGGDQSRAETLALHAFAARPFSRPFATAALTALGPAAPIETTEPVLRRLAQLDPTATADLHRALFEQARFTEALAVFPALTAADVIQPQVMGRHAYGLAVLGRNDEAAEALKQMDGYAPAPSPDARQWSRLTQTRLLLNEKRFDEAVARLDAASAALPASFASVELIEAFADQAPPGDRPDTKTFHAALDRARRETAPAAAQRLAVALRQAQDHAGGAATIIAEPETRLAEGSLTVTVHGPGLAEVEEAALLRAAQAVRRAGADAFLITGRSDVQKSPASGGGFYCTLTVRLVNGGPAAIAATLAWRVIGAGDVLAALERVYAPAGARQSSEITGNPGR